jgi:non-ribosomal peptide synthetase component F
MALLAAFDAVLCLRTGVTDLVLGTDVAGRNSAETEALIGFFVNQLVLRADLSGNPAFRELLARVRSVALAAYAHQEVPFHHLVEILNVRQGLAAAPIFQVKLVLQNAPQAALTLPELALRPVDLQAPETAQLDMNLRVSEGPAGLQLSLQYSTDIYDAATMEGLLEELELVLRTAVAHPETRLSELKDLFERRAAEQRKARAREVEVGDREKLRRIRRAAGHPG